MNILHLTPYAPPAYAFGGVVRAVEGLADGLAARGHGVAILTTDALDATQRYRGARDEMRGAVRVVRARNVSPGLRGRANLSTPIHMGKLARECISWADVIHVHEFRTVENVLVTPLAERMRKPMLLSPHGTLTLATGRGGLKALWDRLISPAMARRFAGIVALTEAEADETRTAWARFAPKQAPPITVISNGIDAEFYGHVRGDLVRRAAFRRRYRLGDAPVCLFLGRLHTRKGVDVLARAFLAANVPDARLVIAGPDEGMRATLEALAGQDQRIVLTGYLDGEDRLDALAAADLFALPAVGEGLSMAALEAMGAGLPVLLSPGCNLPEAETAGAGVIVPVAVEPLADALRLLLSDSVRRQQMGDHGQALIQERFTWARIAEQMEAVYRQAIAADRD